jgi:translation initiation factor 1
MTVCPKCGLPLEACVCQEISKEQKEIIIKTEKRKFGKIITIVSGFEGHEIKEMSKKLKAKLACGGTVKEKEIELQGDHRNKTKKFLVEQGFNESQIKD